MYNFISFLERRDDDLWFRHYETISEMSVAEVEARKPKDGHWSDDNNFHFNVEGDECGKEYCYKVSIRNGYIAFSRNESYKDVRGGFGVKVFDGVHYAIWEYIKKNNPNYLSWSPVATTVANPVTGKVTNPEGRKAVYEIFAIKSLFPDLYVSVIENQWINRKLYDSDYVAGKKYPPVPEGLTNDSSPSEKKKFLQELRNFHAPIYKKENEDLQNRRAREQGNQSRLYSGLSNNRYSSIGRYLNLISLDYTDNLNNFNVGDIVYATINSETVERSRTPNIYNDRSNLLRNLENQMHQLNTNKLKIKGFLQDNDQNYYAEVALVDNNNSQYMRMIFNIDDIKKYTPDQEGIFNAHISNLMSQMLSNPKFNHNSLTRGDWIIDLNGAVGRISNIEFVNPNEFHQGLTMTVNWDASHSLNGEASIRERPFVTNNVSKEKLNDRDIMKYNDESLRYVRQHQEEARLARQRYQSDDDDELYFRF